MFSFGFWLGFWLFGFWLIWVVPKKDFKIEYEYGRCDDFFFFHLLTKQQRMRGGKRGCHVDDPPQSPSVTTSSATGGPRMVLEATDGLPGDRHERCSWKTSGIYILRSWTQWSPSLLHFPSNPMNSCWHCRSVLYRKFVTENSISPLFNFLPSDRWLCGTLHRGAGFWREARGSNPVSWRKIISGEEEVNKMLCVLSLLRIKPLNEALPLLSLWSWVMCHVCKDMKVSLVSEKHTSFSLITKSHILYFPWYGFTVVFESFWPYLSPSIYVHLAWKYISRH